MTIFIWSQACSVRRGIQNVESVRSFIALPDYNKLQRFCQYHATADDVRRNALLILGSLSVNSSESTPVMGALVDGRLLAKEVDSMSDTGTGRSRASIETAIAWAPAHIRSLVH